MTTIAETIRADIIEMIEDDPKTFTFSGTEYRGTSSGINRRKPLEIGGFEEQPELTICINLRTIQGDLIFGQDRPDVGDRITVDDVVYRIDRTEIDSLEEAFQMDLRSIHK